jgi:lysylphosphatidylglycerol synthetase-like protein (DUF2156 family)
MEQIEIDWLVTLFIVHVLGLAATISLFRGAPGWMQRISVILLIAGFSCFCAAYMAAIVKVPYWWEFAILAGVYEHLAVLIYVFRIWWQREEDAWKSSISSRNS